MNGFATTDELSRKDGESWMFRGTVSYCDISAFTCLCMRFCVVLLICKCLFARACVCAWVCVWLEVCLIGVVPFNLYIIMSYLNERYDTERGGSCSVESPQQDC